MESYKDWIKKRERGLLVLALIPSVFMLIAVLFISAFARDLPRIIKFNTYAAALIVGLAISGPRAMKKVTYTEEDLLAGYSALVMMAVFFFVAMNGLYLVDSGLTVTFTDILLYLSTAVLPSSTIAFVLTYEVLDSRRTKRSFALRLKRVFGRLWFAAMFWIGCLIIFRILFAFIPDERVMFVAFVMVGAVSLVLAINFRDLLDDVMNGTW